jgi:catechol 2,3-dioxygenase-like lactoylglutathione lyase family enzyme
MGAEVRHLHLASRDHGKSQRFYEEYFGFRFDAVFPRVDQPAATILRAPSKRFQIYLEGPSEERLPSWFHFGFFVESESTCRDLHDRMKRDGVPIVRPLASHPFASYFCTDPDSHLVQVYFDPRAV